MYEIFIGDIQLKLLPDNLKENVIKDNKKYDVLAIGQVVRPGRAKLKTWSIASAFLFSDGEVISKKEYLDKIVSDDVLGVNPVRLIINRYNQDGSITFATNSLVLVESLEWEDKAGEPGDLYFKINLIEYKKFEAKVIV